MCTSRVCERPPGRPVLVDRPAFTSAQTRCTAMSSMRPARGAEPGAKTSSMVASASGDVPCEANSVAHVSGLSRCKGRQACVCRNTSVGKQRAQAMAAWKATALPARRCRSSARSPPSRQRAAAPARAAAAARSSRAGAAWRLLGCHLHVAPTSAHLTTNSAHHTPIRGFHCSKP